MRPKILIDPHPFLDSVQNWLQDRYDVEFLYLGSAIQRYGPKCNVESYITHDMLNLKSNSLSRFPSWFTENTSTIERVLIQSLKDQAIKYGPWIEAMDLCLKNEDISLILLWNDVTALTKSLTFLGKKYGIPSLHVSHGIPYKIAVHGKIWADKIAVFGESSRELYLANGNPPEKIVITGNPYWDNWGPCSSSDLKKLKKALDLNIDKKVVMFAPTWYHNFRTADDPGLKVKRDLEILLDTMSQLKLINEVELLVKLHSGQKDKMAFYEAKIKARGFSHKIIAETSPLPLIQVSDVILCAGSMVVEALLAGKPLIYNVCDRFESKLHFDFYMSHSFTLDEAPFYVALTRDELYRDLNNALNNRGDFSAEDIKRFLHHQNGPCDGRATERVAELAMEMAVNNNNKQKRVKFISPVSYQKRETYYSNIREDIPSMITGSPQRILEIGCAEGAMGELLKRRYNCEYVGVEVNSEAAHKAEERLDRVIIADVEKTNIEEHHITEPGFDYIIYGDVLEHLYDPWTVIHEHKKVLKDDGYIVVSIPNVRNLQVIESLVNGSWTYKDEGILDSTHLRFFTLQEIKKMFVNCGYTIVDVKCVITPFCDHSKIQGVTNIDLPKLTIKNVSKEEMLELSTVQFIIKAQKANILKSAKLPKCSIIIPVFNQVEYTKQCIETLYKNTPKSLFEIIVVDNNSSDGTKEFLCGIKEKIKVISNPGNLGFAKACNQGAKEASGRYLIFLNNDTVPLPGWLEEMVDSANSDIDAGIVGSRLLYPDGTIQHAGIGFINGIPDHPFRNLPADHPEANVPKELDMVTGACLLIRRDLFFECSGFDEQYKNGVEDIDLCLKVRLKGYKVIYNPKSTLYHYEGRTPGRFDHVKENLQTFFSRWGDYFDDHGKFLDKAENQNILIKWEGSQFVNHSLALVNRELCIELAGRQDIELSLIPYEPHEFGPEEDPERFGLIEERLRKPLSGEADFHVRHQWPPNFTPPPEGHWIIIQPWEFGALPKDWIEPMENLVDELWVPSNYVRDVYVNSGISASRIFVVPNGVNYQQFNPAVSEYKLDTQKRFKFLFVGGTIGRKGIDVLLSAYTEAFTGEDDICLVIKDMGGKSFYKGQNASKMIEDIKKDPFAPEILYLTETLKHKEIAGLYTACDCLVHPYRGEGFGLPVAEAMACGLPVMVTKGGACDDFCSEENAYLIGSTVRPVHLNNCELSAPGWLLEPDKSQLVEMLKFVYQHPDKAHVKGAIAARQIRKKMDWKMSIDLIMERLSALKGKPIRRFASSADHQMVQATKSPQEIYQTIQQSMKNKRPAEVINELEMLAESYPQFALAHNDLGVLHYQAGKKEKAHQFYEKAVQLDPENMVFQKNLADFYYVEMGRVEEALQIYVKILELNPQDIETLLITGHICVALHNFEDAKVFYQRVLELEPSNEAAQNNLNKLDKRNPAAPEFKSPEEMYQEIQPLLNNGDPHKAIASLEKLLQSYPDFALAHNDLGVLYYHTGDKEKARHHYECAVELMPDNINLQKNLADFLFVEQGKVEEALQIYVNILATHPDDVETLLITGHICVALKKFDDAKEFYGRVLALEPDNEDAGQNLKALNNRQTERPLSKSESPQFSSDATAQAGSKDLEPDESENKLAGLKTTTSIIVSLDGISNRLKECLQSIKEHTPESHEILFIHQAATKGNLKWAQHLVEKNANYHLLKCDRNLDWAHCLNQAVEAGCGEYVVITHNDLIVYEGWLERMLQCFQHDPGIGVVGPMSNNAGGIQQVGYLANSDPEQLELHIKEFQRQNEFRRVPTLKLSAFCLMFKRELIEKIGDFDDQFVSEELVIEDFCRRAAAWGYQNVVAAGAYVHHYDRHKAKKGLSAGRPVNTEDQSKFKEKWNGNGAQGPEPKAFQTVLFLSKANELSQKGQIDQAVDILLNAIGVQPEEKRIYLELAEILVAAKRFQDARDALNEMPSENGNPETKKAVLLGYAEEGLENYEAAQACIEKVLAMNPNHAQALNLKGILAYRNNDRNSAEKYFKRAIASDPGYGEPYTNLAMLQLETKQTEEALALFEKGFILSPTDLDIATNYHAFIEGLGDFERAEDVARQAADLYPNNQKIKYMLIDFLVRQGKYEMAMPEIEDAIIKFGIDDGILDAALKIREKLGPMTIKKSSKKAPVSLCMIIKDEEKYLARCLASVKPIVDEMIVVDTGSADRSKDIAITFGAKVYDYDWENDFAAARNFSISKASGEWILILDGDEVISPLDYDDFNKIVTKKPRAPVAYSITTRNYNKLANIVGWMPNDGQYPDEEAAIGWLPSEKVRLFYGKDQIRFEGAVHELVDPVLKRNGIEIKKCSIPVHHYGRLDKEKLDRKGEIYFDIGQKKLSEMGEDINALRELAIQATILEKNQQAS